MRGADFMKEINNLDSDLIKEAQSPRPRNSWNGNIVKVAAVAACVSVFVGGVAVTSLTNKNDSAKQPEAGSSVAETSEVQEETTRYVESPVTDKFSFIPGVNTILTVEDFMEDGKTREEYLNTWAVSNYYIDGDGYAIFATDQVIRVDDMLYSYCSQTLDSINTDVVDGTITSIQLPNTVPVYDNQANFDCLGYQYQKVDDNHLAIKMEENEHWEMFVAGHVGLEAMQGNITPTSTGLSMVVTYTGKENVEAYLGEDNYYLMKMMPDGSWDYCEELIGRQWSETQYILKNGDKYILTVDWSDVYGELEPGLYQFQKDIQIGDESVLIMEDFWVYAETLDGWDVEYPEIPSITEAPTTTWEQISTIKVPAITPVEGTITPTGGTFILDYQKTIEGTCGEQYWICKINEDCVTQDCEMIGELVLPDIAWALEPGKTREFTVDWSSVYGVLESGHYIIKKEIYYGESKEYILGEFTIK